MQEAIAKVYLAATLNARRAAYEIGLKDQLEAKRCSLEMEAITTPTCIPILQNRDALVSSPLLVRQSSKTIILTPEPMCTKTRRIGQHLIDPVVVTTSTESNVKSNPIVTSPASRHKEDLMVNVSSHSNTSERIGMAPRPRVGISPIKKRRPKVSVEDSEVTKLSAPLNSPSDPGDAGKLVSSPRRKRLDELLIHLNNLSENDETTTTELTVNAVVTPTRRKKTIRKKKVDGSVVLDENVLKILQDNNTAAVTKKKKKKKKSLSMSSSDCMNSGSNSEDQTELPRPKRKSPKRTTSRDSSKGNCTTDTELMFDTSSSSFDDSFAFFEFHHTVGNSNSSTSDGKNPEQRLHDSCQTIWDANVERTKAAATANTSSLHDSYITL